MTVAGSLNPEAVINKGMKMEPIEVTNVDVVCGGDMKKLLPPMSVIPKEFKGMNNTNKWNKLVSTWFFSGLEGYSFKPKEGIDPSKALAHVKAIMGSFEPKHEHKEAGCAYLMSEFFESFSKE